MRAVEGFLERVQGTGADVAVDPRQGAASREAGQLGITGFEGKDVPLTAGVEFTLCLSC